MALRRFTTASGKFVYTVQSGDTNTSDLTVTGYTGTITDGAGNALVKSGVTLDTHVQIDTIAPTVTSLADTTTNGSDLNAGQSVSFTLAASETLTIANGAALALSNGASAVYDSASGKFVYTVQSGDTNTSDLTVTGYTGTITDGAGNALVKSGVTLDTHVQIDTIAPTVTALTDTTTNGSDLNAGQSVTFTLTASETLTIANGAALTLSNGASAAYNSSTGKFVYTVQSGDTNTSDLKVTGYTGSIADAAGNALVQAGVTLDTHVQIDTASPTVASVTAPSGDDGPGTVVAFTVNFSEAVTVNTTGGTPTLTLSNGATATYVSGSGSTGLVFNYTVGVTGSGQDAADLATAATNALALNGATIKDSAGNAAVLTGASNVNPTGTLQIDTTAPTVASVTAPSGDDGPGTVVAFTVNFSEAVTVNTTGGTPTLTLSNGATATYVSGSGSTSLVFNYTVGATGSGQDAADLATAVTNALLLNGATIKDSAGNAAVLTGAGNVNPTGTLQIDTTAPTVSITTAGGTTNQGSQTISGHVDVADAGATVKVFDNNGTTPVASTTVLGDGSWSTSVPLVSGTNSLVATVTDAAGNTGTSNTVPFTLPNFTVQWTGASGGNWGTNTNWSTLAVPGSSDDVLIGVADTVDFTTGSSTIDGLYGVAGSSLSVSNGTFTVSSASTASNFQGSLALSGGTFTANALMTVGSLNQSGGTLSGNALVTVSGAASFSGNITETGSAAGSETKVQSGATFAGGTTLTLTARTLDLQGTSSTTGASNNFNDIIDLNNGSSLVVETGATFTDATTSGGGNALVIQSTSGTAGTVANSGTWQKTGNSSGNDTISVAFSTTNGTVSIQNGVLNLTGGGTDTGASYQGAGSIQFGGGTRTLDSASSVTSGVIFSGGTTTVNGTYNASSTTVNGGTANLLGTITGLGATTISGGTLNLSNASTTATSLAESGGTLTGSGLLTVSGAANFSGNSTETGSGAGSETKAQSGATFAGGTTLTLSARTLDLQGTSSTTGASNNFNDIINLNNGSSLTVDTGATFTDATTAGGGNALLIQSTAGTAGTVTNLGTWQKTGNGKSVVNVAFSNSGSINAQQGTLQLTGALTNLAGSSLVVQNATIELAAVSGGTNVSFGATSGTLQLDSTVSTAQSAAVSAVSSGAAMTITGNGSVTSTSADAIDATSSGGNISITPAGAVTGAKVGISVVQNGTGNITVTGSGPIIGQSGQGIFAEENSSASGSITINGSGSGNVTGNSNSGILAEILNTANGSNIIVDQTGSISGGDSGIRAFTDGNGNITITTASGVSITGSQLFGISAGSFGTGSISVTTASGDIITSGSAGISAFNDATSIPQVGGLTTSSITVTAAGTINSGTTLTSSYFPPAGIVVGYNGTSVNGGLPNPSVFGNVFVNNSANINAAAGDGIRTYNYGNGNITVADLAGTTVATPDRFGILATAFGIGDISISTAATTDTINSGSTGIQANNDATNISAAATSTIGITALGTINSGLATTGGEPGGIGAGYNGGNSGTFNPNVQGNVSVDSSATIHAALGAGVELFNWGTGNVTATLETSSVITATAQGVSAFAQGGGNVTVTNHGAITVATGVGIGTGTGTATGAGTNGLITITNTGSVDGLGSVSRPVIQINNGSTKGASFTNSGTITADQFSTSEQNLAVADFNGSATINNSGTIKGNIGLANGTFNNNSGGIWNVNGLNLFGSGANAVNNAGTINASGTSVFGASGTLAFNNSGAVNLSADSYTYVGGAVSGFNGTSGTFTIGDFATLELTSAFAAGQTVS